MALCVGFFFGSQFLAVEYMRLCDDEQHTCNGKLIIIIAITYNYYYL